MALTSIIAFQHFVIQLVWKNSRLLLLSLALNSDREKTVSQTGVISEACVPIGCSMLCFLATGDITMSWLAVRVCQPINPWNKLIHFWDIPWGSKQTNETDNIFVSNTSVSALNGDETVEFTLFYNRKVLHPDLVKDTFKFLQILCQSFLKIHLLTKEERSYACESFKSFT